MGGKEEYPTEEEWSFRQTQKLPKVNLKEFLSHPSCKMWRLGADAGSSSPSAPGNRAPQRGCHGLWKARGKCRAGGCSLFACCAQIRSAQLPFERQSSAAAVSCGEGCSAKGCASSGCVCRAPEDTYRCLTEGWEIPSFIACGNLVGFS